MAAKLIGLDPSGSINNGMVRSLYRFSVKLYIELVKQYPSENLLFSPLGVASALALVAAGSRGRTKEEISYIFWTCKFPNLDAVYKTLLNSLAFNNNNTAVFVDNLLLMHKSYDLERTFKKLFQKYNSLSVQKIDFSTDYRASLEQVNAWVSQTTSSRIKSLDCKLYRNTALVNANLVYHRTHWMTMFNPDGTKRGEFHVADGRTVPMQFMSHTGIFKCRFDKVLQCHIVALPYNDKKTTMLLIIPNEVLGLENVQSAICRDLLENIIIKMKRKHEISLELPKFQLEQTHSLGPVLKAMKVKELFNQGSADLQNMSKDPTLYLNQFLLKGILHVTDEGFVCSRKSVSKNVPVVRADHPFLYLVYNETTKMISLMGRFVEPPHQLV